MSRLVLNGCTPEPLSSYLTSLAIHRLVSEQIDPDAKGWWENGYFALESTLDEEGLVGFFQEKYAPTPIVAPWSGGSGFYEGDKIDGIECIRNSSSHQFDTYRETIEKIFAFPEMPPTGLSLRAILAILETEARGKRGKAKENILESVEETRSQIEPVARLQIHKDLLSLRLQDLEEASKLPRKATASEKERSRAIKGLLKSAKKAFTKIKQLRREAGKEKLIQVCRDRLSDRAVEWIDAAAVIGPEGDIEYPPILGSGGNEGRLDYSNAFMSSLAMLLLSPENKDLSQRLSRNALFGESTDDLTMVKVGQYNPGRSGGFNQGQGIENKEFPANPWSFVLTLEGSIVWASSVARRQGAERGFLRSPFTVRASPVGYSSSSDKDEARAEIWAPLWDKPASYREVHTFLSEGRADVGRKSAGSGIEFAEAASSLGIDRGVCEFVRYSLLKRRGDSYVALPTGRFSVHYRSESDLVRELGVPLRKIDGFLARFKDTPARLESARRQIDKSIFDLLQNGGPSRVKSLVAALGRMEQLLAERDLSKPPKLNSPVYGLSPKWIVADDDGSLEIRIAVALASIAGLGDVGPIRANLSQVDPSKPWLWAKGRGQVAWQGNSLIAKMSAVLERRMMDSQRLHCRSNPLFGHIPLHAEDIAGFIEGFVDEKLVENLLFGLTWIRWDDRLAVRDAYEKLMEKWSTPVTPRIVPRPWALLKLLFLPGPQKFWGTDEVNISPEPSIIPLLLAGRTGNACSVAQRRLYSSGLSPIMSQFPDASGGARIAAALLLPVQRSRQVAGLVLRKKD